MKEEQKKLRSLVNFKFYKSLQNVHPLTKASASFIATALLIIFLFFAFIQPAILKINELKNQTETLSSIKNKLIKKKKTLVSLKKEYLDLQKFSKLADQAVPTQSEFNLFDKQMRFLVLNNGLVWDSLNFTGFDIVKGDSSENDESKTKNSKKQTKKQSKKNVNVSTLGFNLSAHGSYSDIKNFIKDLQSLVRVIEIDNFDINLGRDQQQLDFKLSGTIFYQDKIK